MMLETSESLGFQRKREIWGLWGEIFSLPSGVFVPASQVSLAAHRPSRSSQYRRGYYLEHNPRVAELKERILTLLKRWGILPTGVGEHFMHLSSAGGWAQEDDIPKRCRKGNSQDQVTLSFQGLFTVQVRSSMTLLYQEPVVIQYQLYSDDPWHCVVSSHSDWYDKPVGEVRIPEATIQSRGWVKKGMKIDNRIWGRIKR